MNPMLANDRIKHKKSQTAARKYTVAKNKTRFVDENFVFNFKRGRGVLLNSNIDVRMSMFLIPT